MRLHRVGIDGIQDLELATGGNREFRPTQIGPHEPSGRLAISVFSGLTLTYGRFSGDIHVTGTLSNEKLTFGVLLSGTKGVTIFGKDAKLGDLVVVGEGRENDARYRSELEYVAVNVDKSDVLRIADSDDLAIPRGVLDGSDLLRLDDRKATRLARRMTTISNGLRNGPLQTIGPEAERWLADEIILEFVYSLSDSSPRERVGDRPRRDLPRLVKRAVDWLDADPSRQPYIDVMARVLAVSPRQLYRAFHAEVGLSPAKFLKHHRMTQVKLELVEADPAETTVTHATNSWGFWELGRFAVEYRQLFGESPSETLQRSPGIAECVGS